jgi:uncharacterized membrane protein YdjX (TVP38/TMEM64 family)
MKARSVVKLVLALAAVVAAVGALRLLPVARWGAALIERSHAAGAAGALLFAAAYIVAPLLLLPASILTVGAGFLYGRIAGTLLVAAFATIAACLAFWLGRTLFRERVRKRIEGDTKLRAIDAAIGEHGFRLVLLLRLSPVVPFNLLNYALGATQVGFGSYAVASLIGMLPGTFLFVSIGAAATSAAQLQGGVQAPSAALWIGIAATVATVVLITLAARKALQAALPGEQR